MVRYEMSKKRHREPLAIDIELVAIYDDLANVDRTIRLKAAHSLLTTFVSDGKATVEQLNEILRRLIRGLCSGRKAARLGFSVALTEYLNALLGPEGTAPSGFQDISGVVDTLTKQTKVGGAADGQEDRDHHIGQLFGAEAVLKSGILFHARESLELSKRILDVIYELAKKKPWLREQCGFVLYQSVETPSDLKKCYAQQVIDKLHSSGLAKTPEGIAIWIAIQSKYTSVKFPGGVWQGSGPLDRTERSKLALALREASSSELDDGCKEDKPPQRGSWNAKVHFAWLVVIAQLSAYSTTNRDKKATSARLDFREFWRDCVDDSLFKSESSDERRYWGFSLFQQVLPAASPEVVSSILSPKLLGSLQIQLASSARFLHLAAEKARKALLGRADADPNIKIAILETLVANGHIDFDSVSKTKTIDALLSGNIVHYSRLIFETYRAAILQPGTPDLKIATARRRLAADQIVNAVRSVRTKTGSSKLDKDSELFVQSLLTLLAQFAYFNFGSPSSGSESSPYPEISKACRDTFRARLSSCLTNLVGKVDDSCLYVYHLVCAIAEGQGRAKILVEADEAVQSVLDLTVNTLEDISLKVSGNSTDRKFYKSALLLLSLTFLQVHNGDLDAVSMLEELNETFSKKQLKNLGKQDFEAPAALIEILLSLAAKPSQLFRRISCQVFESFTWDLEEAGLRSMLKVLETKESLKGQTELFDQEDGDGEEGNEEDDLESDTSDVEMSDVEILSQSNNGSDIDDSTHSSDSADGEEADGPDDELAAFDAKLAQALGTRPGNADLDAEDSSSSDEDMNDEEMETLDKHLETVFKEQKKAASKKVEKKDAKETIVNFKCRVLELLEILVKKRHGKPLVLEIILPMLTVLRTTTSPLVSNKASNLMREYARLCKGKEMPHVESSKATFGMLGAIHDEAMKSASNAHASACSQASLLLVKLLAADQWESLDKVVDLYAATWALARKRAISEKHYKIKTSFFLDFDNWVSSAKPKY